MWGYETHVALAAVSCIDQGTRQMRCPQILIRAVSLRMECAWEWQGVQHRCTEAEVGLTLVEELCLQQPIVDVTELEDVRWFHRSWLRRHLHHVGACSF